MTASQDISRLKMIGEIDPPTTGGAAATRSTLTGESGWRGEIDLPELNESPDWSLGGKQTTKLQQHCDQRHLLSSERSSL